MIKNEKVDKMTEDKRQKVEKVHIKRSNVPLEGENSHDCSNYFHGVFSEKLNYYIISRQESSVYHDTS